MDPSDPKFQLLVGMMSDKRRTALRPGCGWIVLAAIVILAACLLAAGLAAH
jgi:hypothetical protein